MLMPVSETVNHNAVGTEASLSRVTRSDTSPASVPDHALTCTKSRSSG